MKWILGKMDKTGSSENTSRLAHGGMAGGKKRQPRLSSAVAEPLKVARASVVKLLKSLRISI